MDWKNGKLPDSWSAVQSRSPQSAFTVSKHSHARTLALVRCMDRSYNPHSRDQTLVLERQYRQQVSLVSQHALNTFSCALRHTFCCTVIESQPANLGVFFDLRCQTGQYGIKCHVRNMSGDVHSVPTQCKPWRKACSLHVDWCLCERPGYRQGTIRCGYFKDL